jgi:choline dehydrogenase-like flavoprotein
MAAVDVLIIGAGASAAAFAWSLADTKMQIVCLEQGDWVDHQSYPANAMDWESRSDFSSNPNMRQAPADYPVNCADSDIDVANYNGVGGGTILYAGHFPRLHPSDFKVRTLDGVAEDWPIDYQTLEPYFALNDRMMGVSGLAGDPAYPPKQPMMPPLPLGRSGQTLAQGFNKLGWHWWPSDCAINTEIYEGRDKCINLGACGAGCAQGAKASVDVTYWPLALNTGVELRTQCRVREITVGPDGLASGAIYIDANADEQTIQAHMVIVACNGIGTPRLLLNSVSSMFPDGLANSSGLVGKNLMFHPYAGVDGVFAETLDGNIGPHKGINSHEFYETEQSRGFTRGFSYEMHRGYGPVGTALVGMNAKSLPFGANHHDGYRKLSDRMLTLVALCEDLPELHNEVVLDPDQVDAFGIPAAKVNYKVSKNSQAMLSFSIERAKEVLQASGAVETLREIGPVRSAGWHNLGTARMGNDPKNSVVNAWGRSHDVKNLFVIDGSIFVTGGAVNPTSTIQALALYVADSIKSRLSDGSLFD